MGRNVKKRQNVGRNVKKRQNVGEKWEKAAKRGGEMEKSGKTWGKSDKMGNESIPVVFLWAREGCCSGKFKEISCKIHGEIGENKKGGHIKHGEVKRDSRKSKECTGHREVERK